MHRLPTELNDQIISYCGQRELHALSLADRHLSCLAILYLYQKVERLSTLGKTTKLLTSLLLYDRGAPLVQSFAINLVWFSASLTHQVSKKSLFLSLKKFGTRKALATRDAFHNYLTLISAVLRKLVNLTHLVLIFEHEESHDEICDRLLSGTHFQLNSISSSFILGPAFCRFLEGQTQLQELHLSSHIPYRTSFLDSPSNVLSSSSISNVTTIGWSIKTPVQVVRFISERVQPRKVVVDLTATIYYENLTMANYLHIGQASKTVERATVDFGSSMKAEFVDLTFISFPSLGHLNIVLYTVTEELVKAVLESASPTKTLRHLVITGYYSAINGDWRPILHSVAENAFSMWEHLAHLEIAVSCNKQIWHASFKRSSTTVQNFKTTLNSYVYLSFV